MPAKIIEIEAESLEDARRQIKSLTVDGLYLLSEKIISDGEPRKVRATSDTTEAALENIQPKIPANSDVLESKVIVTPGEEVVRVEAFDEKDARLSAEKRVQSKYGNSAIVSQFKLATEGKKGFLGFGKTPNQYEFIISRLSVVEIVYKPKAKIIVEMGFSYTNGLRPLGNKKRLTYTTDEVSYGIDVGLLLFYNREKAERYYDLFTGYAKKNPPPYLIEVMFLFIPGIPSAEKYGVVIPYETVDLRPEYKQWAINAMRSCNESIRVDQHRDHSYKLLHKVVDVVYKWDILVPRDFSENSIDAKELLHDDANEGFPPLRVLLQEVVSLPPDRSEPQGPWVGVLFEIESFDDVLYGRAATKFLLEIVGVESLTNCLIHGGDILPESKYWCLALHTFSVEQARRIEEAVLASSERHLAPVDTRLLRNSEIPIRTLLYWGFVSKEGVYIGR